MTLHPGRTVTLPGKADVAVDHSKRIHNLEQRTNSSPEDRFAVSALAIGAVFDATTNTWSPRTGCTVEYLEVTAGLAATVDTLFEILRNDVVIASIILPANKLGCAAVVDPQVTLGAGDRLAMRATTAFGTQAIDASVHIWMLGKGSGTIFFANPAGGGGGG